MFRLPTQTVINPGAVARLPDVVDSLRAKKIFLIFDKGLSETSWPSVVRQGLSHPRISIEEFTDVAPNPRTFQVDQAAECARAFGAELVIGLGGGSVLDTAKAVAMLCRNIGSCLNFEGKEIFSNEPLPFVAIPTTCGTGSEVTWVSVISDPDTKRKISIKGTRMFPTVALVDANLIETLPPDLITYTGVDALTHALEALVSKCSNPVSDALAVTAIRIILDHIGPCVANSKDPIHREAMMRGSTLAGIAFGNADVGAVHCLSESIGGVFDHPHGLLNAQLLVPVMRYQIADIEHKLNESADMGPAPELFDLIESQIESLGIPAFGSLQLPREAISLIAQQAEQNNSNASNPKTMTAADYERILDPLIAEN